MFAAIGTGVERALLHGPGLVVVEDGGLKTIEEAGLDNVYVLLQTTETGIIADSSEPLPTTVYVGQEGEFPVMAMELDYDKENVIITSGDAPFGHYAGMYDIEKISALIQPVIVVTMAVLVGVMAYMMITVIFDTIGGMEGGR